MTKPDFGENLGAKKGPNMPKRAENEVFVYLFQLSALDIAVLHI